jgi:polyisoprenoid-binding protein YceI
MKSLTRLACCALSLLLAPGLLVADPGQWSSVAADSELGFAAYYEGEELPGRFAAFGVRLETDAETGAPTALFVEVQTGSADMNDREVNAEIVEPEWFDARSFPTANFECRDIRPAESGFLASGRLRLKGIEQALEIPFEWRREGETATLSGSVTLSRQAWEVGTGEWSNNASLSDRVDLHYRVTLGPAD